MPYQVTFTLNAAYTGTTEADDFTIIGNPGNVVIATNISRATLTAGVMYDIDNSITGGTVTSNGICTNSVNWTGFNFGTPDPTPTPTATDRPAETYYTFHHCGGGDPQFTTFGVSNTKLVTAGMLTTDPLVGDTVTISGSPNVDAVWEYRGESALSDDAVTVLTYNVETCTNPV